MSERFKRDPITGRKSKENVLNRKTLSHFEIEEYMIGDTWQ